MQSTLSQLYYGNLYPFLTYKPALEETVHLFKAAGGRYDRFRARLPEFYNVAAAPGTEDEE